MLCLSRRLPSWTMLAVCFGQRGLKRNDCLCHRTVACRQRMLEETYALFLRVCGRDEEDEFDFMTRKQVGNPCAPCAVCAVSPTIDRRLSAIAN